MDQNPDNSIIRRWFALYTKPRREFKAATELNAAGIEYYLPTLTVVKQWSDRKKKVTEPLFRGYIFIHASEKERLISVELESIVRTIFFNGRPSVIPDYQIEGLKKMIEEGIDVFVVEGLTEGTPVKIISGPFKDIEGVVVDSPTDGRMLAITVETLNRSVIVRLSKDSVIKKRDIN